MVSNPHNILLSERFTDSLNVISPTQLRYTAFSVNVHMNELLVAVESQDKTSFNEIPYSFYLSGTRDYLLLPEGPYMAAEARGYLSLESVIQRGHLHLSSADQLLVLLVPKWDISLAAVFIRGCVTFSTSHKSPTSFSGFLDAEADCSLETFSVLRLWKPCCLPVWSLLQADLNQQAIPNLPLSVL